MSRKFTFAIEALLSIHMGLLATESLTESIVYHI